MSANILIIWSNYYQDLAEIQLDSCIELLQKKNYSYQLEKMNAGTYEIPIVIQHFQTHQPFMGYLPLGLLIKGSTDHYEFIWDHINHSFTHFALQGLPIGNGVISAPTLATLAARVNNQERVQEAVNALDYLIELKNRKL